MPAVLGTSWTPSICRNLLMVMLLLPKFGHGLRAITLFGRNTASRHRVTARCASTRLGSDVDAEHEAGSYRVCLAVGSNMGDRFQNIHSALQLLCHDDDDDDRHHLSNTTTKLLRTSFLRETAPMYVTNQPNFLNGAALLETPMTPRRLLQKIKRIEQQLGRDIHHDGVVRNGPRPVDLDILFYESVESEERESTTKKFGLGTPVLVNEPDLIVPHNSIQERQFVVEPLMDLLGRDYVHPVLQETLSELWEKLGVNEDEPKAVRVIPLARDRVLHLNRTIIMGILNVTPDSFSDGGKWSNTDAAVQHALAMAQDGADIIDIGGESTRPGARELDIDVELERTIPVIEQLRKLSDVPISIDTRHSSVARAAIAAGADLVNDVSGGQFDPNMLTTVAELAVPMVLMHMRGTPETMQSMTVYTDVVKDVTSAISERSRAAESAGIHRWCQIIDPGIGFAKDLEGNLKLLKHVSELRSGSGNLPILLGTSRKGFIGRITDTNKAEDRDAGTIATFVAAVCLDSTANDGCNLVRVHNVPLCKQAAAVMDAICRA